MGGLKYVALSVLALVAASVAIGAFFGWAALVLFPFGVFIGVATISSAPPSSTTRVVPPPVPLIEVVALPKVSR